MFTWRLLLNFLGLYWKSIFMVVYPLVLIPVIVATDQNKRLSFMCLYVVLLMAGYWVLEIIPLAITALFPLVFFPCMGILDCRKTSQAYFKEANMMFVGGLIIALAVEFCNLHNRISLHAISFIGCSYRRLHFGLSALTVLISMWISNTAATAMMLPIIAAVLEELESSGLGKQWEDSPIEDEGPVDDISNKKPTRIAMCFYIGTAYFATIGGLGCLVGSGTNLVFKGIYETEFPGDKAGVSFTYWLGANGPYMFIVFWPTWLWLQIWYMGLFRPKSQDAQAVNVGKEGEEVTRQLLLKKLEELGPMSAHEIQVAVLFVCVALLWFFRRPGFMTGWGKALTNKDSFVGDSTAAIFIVVLLFLLPARFDFLWAFSKDVEKRPTKNTQSLITWKFINQKMHWSLIFLMGGGFALSEGIQASKMGEMVARSLESISSIPQYALLVVTTLMTIVVTQFTSSAAIANILLPIVASITRNRQIHPMYMMMPVSLTSSLSFTMPVSTPPNAIAAAPCNMSTWEMLKVALGVELICYVCLILIFPFYGKVYWDFDTFPDWAGAHGNKTH